MLKKILFTTLFLLTIVLSSVYYLFHRSKPVSEGVVFLKGLESKVRIVKDEWGVPHITSESERDAYFALGFVMASERLFQMDIQRRLANGQLSEVLGKRTLEVDKKFRTLRFRKAMVELMEKRKKEGKRNKKMWSHLTAFYEGVNEYIKKNPLPIEFHLLGYEPKPFGP
ncbi:MAG: penicillin acylase family protein, partial [Bdellovibrionota bacterium]|nr:penicillin acylase family protein [Bdellovibrionota bacterium]